ESHILTDTLDILEAVVVPVNDLIDISQRLEGKENIPLTVEAPAQAFQVGAKDEFWLVNTDTNDNFQIDATLRYVTEHAYFWIEDGVSYDHDELEALAETFENKIYPTNREFFGSEWSPGVDDDPHLYIIYAGGLGYGLAGYYSSSDEYPPQAHEYSNAHETFVFNADNVSFSEEFTLGVLAHEFQHMIHWYRDRNESTWLNEGFSELAAFINGYDVGGFDYAYTNEPDLQLNDWPNDQDATSPHYGAAFLFVTYFLDRFGEDATQALVGHADNGMSSVDAVLAEIDAPDTLNADDVFVDWVLASYLHDENVADGRYTYHNYPDAPQPNPTENIKSCSTDTMTRDVHQYGVDYIRIVCRGDYTFHFEGSTQVSVLPADAYSGDFAFWSNKGDESDMTLTRSFDFSDHTAPLTLSYWTWYDLEEDYDYLFLEASLDGEYWQIIQTPSGVINDPSGNSYGWAYNGLSGGDGRWIQEQVDISQFAGQEVQIRFEYITDAAVNGEGFLLDDIAIPETGYSSDLEEDSGGWDAAGFVRIQNILPQTFSLALITKGETTSVEYIPVSADNVADIPLHIGADVDEAILVVTATTRYTRQKAAYRFEIAP
ncbi:MAG: immune inhibitor A, partial [Chloroflexota bacterium]|nr:immune inhibitor A [Chloroflexota bacterium]